MSMLASSEDGRKETVQHLPDPDVEIENSRVYVKRPWLKDLLRKDDLDKLKTKKLELTEEQRAERRRRAREMEIERRKALKAALRRAKMNKLAALEENLAGEQV